MHASLTVGSCKASLPWLATSKSRVLIIICSSIKQFNPSSMIIWSTPNYLMSNLYLARGACWHHYEMFRFLAGVRAFSSAASETDPSLVLKSALRGLYKLVHPDLFHGHPKEQVSDWDSCWGSFFGAICPLNLYTSPHAWPCIFVKVMVTDIMVTCINDGNRNYGHRQLMTTGHNHTGWAQGMIHASSWFWLEARTVDINKDL